MEAKEKIRDLKEREKIAKLGGGIEQIEKQHRLGKLTARERIEHLIDPGSFLERGLFVTHRCTDFGMERRRFLTDGVVTGSGKINNRLVYVFAQDFTVLGGSLGENHAKRLLTSSKQLFRPKFLLSDFLTLAVQNSGRTFPLFHDLSEKCRSLGSCASDFGYPWTLFWWGYNFPSLGDFVFIVDGIGHMFTSGPGVVKAVTGEEINAQELGGAKVHSKKSGVADFQPNPRMNVFKRSDACFRFFHRIVMRTLRS
jgi:propionyl-CoA carboxylase beta chain